MLNGLIIWLALVGIVTIAMFIFEIVGRGWRKLEKWVRHSSTTTSDLLVKTDE